MKILYKHFDNNTTYIVGNYISNGCELFHKDDAESVFNEYKVPQKMRYEVLSYCNDNEDWETLAKHQDLEVRYLVVFQDQCLDILVNDSNWLIRYEVAKKGFGLDKLINDKDFRIIREVATQLILKNNEN